MKINQLHNRWSLWKHYFPHHQLIAGLVISVGMTFVLSILPDNVIANRSNSLLLDEENSQFSSEATEHSVAENQSGDTLQPSYAKPITAVEDPWMHLSVGKGDTLSSILQAKGLSLSDIHEIVHNSEHSKKLASLQLGDQLDILMDNGKLKELHLEKSKLEKITVIKDGDRYQTSHITKEPEIRQAFATGKIESSLFLAGQKAGLDDRMILQLADIFAYDIDFMLDIQEDDTFSVIYEDQYVDGEHVGKGRILAAEFINDGKTYQAVYYASQDGTGHYYSPKGEILRKQFLRTPVDFAKITSYFSLNRKHPILHKIRAHKGIDYGAPTGTPVRAAGDGKVVFAGNRNGYGNTIMIQHGAVYTTLYAHLNKINVKAGSKVEQGQLIGQVGSTGLATGPHLHYEFHVNGVAQNPLANKNVAMAEPLSKSEMANFAKSTTPLLEQLKQRLATAKKLQQLAMAESDSEPSRKQ